jgi:hypothetical protein
MPRDRVPGYTRPLPPPAPIPRRQATPGVDELTRMAARRVTPTPGARSLTPPAQPQDTLEDLERTPPEPRIARAGRLEYEAHEELRRDIAAAEGRDRVLLAESLAACRSRHGSQIKLWLAFGAAILTAIGAIAVAVVQQTGDATRIRTVQSASDTTAKQLAVIDSRLVELGKELRAMRSDQREDRADILARIAARPLVRDPDIVSARPVASRGTGGAPENPYSDPRTSGF